MTSSPVRQSSAPAHKGAAPATAPARHKLLSDINLDFGPRDLLGRFFLKADTAARHRGISLSFAPVQTLLEVNRSNADTWRPLLPIFQPALSGVTDETGFAIIGRNLAGDVVVTQGACLYDWRHTNFKEEAESLRLFYSAPERMAQPGEACPVTAPAASKLSGRVVFSGAVWVRPDYRGRLVTAILPRISRAAAYTRWASDVTLTIMAEAVVKGGVAERAGYRNVDWDLTLVNSPVGRHIRCALLWMRSRDMLEDLGAFDSSAGSEIDPIVGRRTA